MSSNLWRCYVGHEHESKRLRDECDARHWKVRADEFDLRFNQPLNGLPALAPGTQMEMFENVDEPRDRGKAKLAAAGRNAARAR